MESQRQEKKGDISTTQRYNLQLYQLEAVIFIPVEILSCLKFLLPEEKEDHRRVKMIRDVTVVIKLGLVEERTGISSKCYHNLYQLYCD